jgi:hypothetical protein
MFGAARVSWDFVLRHFFLFWIERQIVLERSGHAASLKSHCSLAELLQRLGHKNCRACFLLQSVALKSGSLIHANRLMIFVHHL